MRLGKGVVTVGVIGIEVSQVGEDRVGLSATQGRDGGGDPLVVVGGLRVGGDATPREDVVDLADRVNVPAGGGQMIERCGTWWRLPPIHISEPTTLPSHSVAVFC